MILGAMVYRSRKRRLLGLRTDTQGRVAFEIMCLALLTFGWLGLRDLVLNIEGNAIAYFVVPVWALTAYPFAGFRSRPKTAKHQGRAATHWTSGPVALGIAVAVGATIAWSSKRPDLQPELDLEPVRPPQAVLDAVSPLGLTVSIGQPFEIAGASDDDGEWFVPVECEISDTDAQRLAAPNPGERWLFGVLWGEDSRPPRTPRSYIQPVPKLTLSLSSTPGGDIREAAWAIFQRCPLSTERLLLPLWPEDAATLIDGSGSSWIRADAIGLPRGDPRISNIQNADSFEDAAKSLIQMGLAIESGELAMIPVDGLVNGGPVFEVQDFTVNPSLSNAPSATDLIR